MAGYVVILVDDGSTVESVESAVSSITSKRGWSRHQCRVLSRIDHAAAEIQPALHAEWDYVAVSRYGLGIIGALGSWLDKIPWRSGVVTFWDTRMLADKVVGPNCANMQEQIEQDRLDMVWPLVQTPEGVEFHAKPYGLLLGSVLVSDLCAYVAIIREHWLKECGDQHRLDGEFPPYPWLTDPIGTFAQWLYQAQRPLRCRLFTSWFDGLWQAEQIGARIARPIVRNLTPAIYGSAGWDALARRKR